MCNYALVGLLVLCGFAIGTYAGFLVGRHFQKAIS